MYSYLEKKENATTINQKPIHTLHPPKTNTHVVQNIMTRRREKLGNRRKWVTPREYFSSRDHYGRDQLYRFGYSQEVLDTFQRNITTNPADSDTIDHKRSLAELFEEYWPLTLERSYRRKQYNNIDNLQILSKRKNSSKGSKIRGSRRRAEYNQRMATACMIYERLGCPVCLQAVLAKYGDEEADENEVLEEIEKISD